MVRLFYDYIFWMCTDGEDEDIRVHVQPGSYILTQDSRTLYQKIDFFQLEATYPPEEGVKGFAEYRTNLRLEMKSFKPKEENGIQCLKFINLISDHSLLVAFL